MAQPPACLLPALGCPVTWGHAVGDRRIGVARSQAIDRQGSPQPTTVHDPDALRRLAIIELMDETQVDVDLDDALAADIMINTVESNDLF